MNAVSKVAGKYLRQWAGGMGTMVASRQLTSDWLRKEASVSPHVLKMVEVMSRGGGKTSMVNINILQQALALLEGWSVAEGTSVTPLDDNEKFDPHIKAWLQAHNAKTWGYSGRKEPKEIWFNSLEDAKRGHATLFRHVGKATKKGPARAERGKIYVAEVGQPSVDEYGRPKIVTRFWFMGVPSFTFSAPNGSTVTVTPSVGYQGQVADVTQMKIARFWTWAYKQGLREQAAEYLAEGGQEQIDAIRRKREIAIRSLDGTGTCPACFRNVKLASNRIMRHGWNVVGGGSFSLGAWHTSSCFGHGYLPYELSKMGTVKFRKVVEKEIPPLQKHLTKLQKNPPDPLKVTQGKRTEEVPASARSYKHHLKRQITNTEEHLRAIEDMLRDLDARIASWTQQPLPGSKVGTLSRSEKEEREDERLVRPAPKKKPPRQDLRRNRIKEEDPDAKPNAETDKDLSRNHKFVANKVAALYLARKIKKEDKPKKPGDYWQTDNGWGVFPPNAKQPTSAPDEEAAKALSEGKGKSKGEDAPKGPTPEDKTKARRKKLRQFQKFEDSITDMAAEMGKPGEALVDTYSKLNDKQQAAAAQEYKTQLDWLTTKHHKPTKKMWADVDKVLSGKAKIGDSPEEIAQALAKHTFYSKVISDPSMATGSPLGTATTPETLHESGKKSLHHYAGAGKRAREHARTAWLLQMEAAEDGSSEKAELEKVGQGLMLASVLNDEELTATNPDGEGVTLAPPISKAYRNLAKRLHADGQADKVLANPKDFWKSSTRSQLEDAAKDLDTDDLKEVMGGDDGPYGPIFSAMSDVSDADQEFVKEILRDLMVFDITLAQGHMNDLEGKTRGGEESKSKQDTEAAPSKAKSRDALFNSVLSGVHTKMADNPVVPKSAEDKPAFFKWMAGLFVTETERVREREGLEWGKSSPAPQLMRHLSETGNVDVLAQPLVFEGGK